MADSPDTIETPNSQTPTDPSAQTDASPAPGSSDTTTSDDGTLLGGDGKPADAPAADDDAKPADTPGDKPAGDPAQPAAELFGAPEGDAEYEVTGLPEGVELDKEALAAVTPLARELNLSNAGLSKLAGVYTESVLPHVTKQVSDQIAAQVNSDVQKLRNDWATDTRALVSGGKNAAGEDVQPDPAFKGQPLADVQKVAAKALDRFGGDGFRQFLNENGLGNHPAMMRFAYLAGSAISEDQTFERGGDVPQPKTREQKYYGNNG